MNIQIYMVYAFRVKMVKRFLMIGDHVQVFVLVKDRFTHLTDHIAPIVNHILEHLTKILYVRLSVTLTRSSYKMEIVSNAKVAEDLISHKGDVNFSVMVQERYIHQIDHSVHHVNHIQLLSPPILFVVTHHAHQIR